MAGSHNVMLWHRIKAAFANKGAASGPCAPTVGLASYACSCCGRHWIAIACVAEDGSEVNVALPLATALDVAEKIAELVAAGPQSTRGGVH